MHYIVEPEVDELGHLLGWSVYLNGSKVAGPYETEHAAQMEAQRLEALALEREAALLDIQSWAKECQVSIQPNSTGNYVGKLLALNEHYLLINAGRGAAHIADRSLVESANIQVELGKLLNIQIINGKATNRTKPLQRDYGPSF